MDMEKKIPSQNNLIKMLVAAGRGYLDKLTQRFNDYDAAVAQVAEHTSQIASINQGKTSWANGGTITSEVYYKILKGTQDSFTLPFDLNGFVSGITANGNAQRYSGVMFAVSYANKPGNPKQRSDTLYLPFAAVNAEKGVVAFEDLQFRYADLAGADVDVRYKVTPISNSQIKLEKMEENASTELPWLEFTVNVDELTSALSEAGARYEINNLSTESIDPSLYRGIKLTDNAGALYYFPFMFHMDDRSDAWCSDFTDADKTWRVTFGSGQNTLVFDDITPAAPDLSDYAKKTDLPQQPMTLLVCGDNGNTTDMNGDTFTLTPTKLKDGSVDYFYVGLTAQMVSRLNALFGELNKAQDPHGSDVYVADTNPVNMLPTLMLTFYDGSIAYRFDAVKSSPGELELVFKGNIPGTSGGISTWLAVLALAGAQILEFRLIK